MEFYDQVETINGKSNNIVLMKFFWWLKNVWCPANFNKTVADVQNVAKKYFTKSNRTVGFKTNVEN
jgi:hypothetical protein